MLTLCALPPRWLLVKMRASLADTSHSIVSHSYSVADYDGAAQIARLCMRFCGWWRRAGTFPCMDYLASNKHVLLRAYHPSRAA
jgi:hypothetical protein